MEEKKAKIGYSFRSLSGSRYINKLILQHKNYSPNYAFSLLNKEKGFTLVELIIVVAIIGILAAGLLTVLDPANQLKNSRDGRRKSDLKQIQTALELYRADQGVYPNPLNNTVAICGTNAPLAVPCVGSDITYLQSIPRDPKVTTNNGHYFYCTSTTSPCNAFANGYAIYSCMENVKDKESIATGPSMGCPSGSKYLKLINP